MTATEEIFARVEAAAGSGARHGGGLENHELAALRNLLVGSERAQIRKLLQRLDDPATRAAEIARILPEAIALRKAEDDGLTGTMIPVVRDALAGALREHPDLLVTAMRGALRQTVYAPWRLLGRAFRRRRTHNARIEHMYLIDRATGDVFDHVLRPINMSDDHAEEDSRRVVSMVTYLLAFLRDPEHLLRYADLGQIRIEQFTYGVCAGAGVVLLSVIHGNSGIEDQLAECREILMKLDKDWCDGHRTHKDHSWLPRFEGDPRPTKKASVIESDGRPNSISRVGD